ncbi:hypothetical protein P3S67_023783 [Capsicum chacoense]
MACMNKGREILSRKIKSIAERWEILSGKTNWEGLLDPLDYDLRRYLIHYGQMPQAIGDSFNSEPASKYYGTSRYSTKNLFKSVGLDQNNPYKYEITKYFYAASEEEVSITVTGHSMGSSLATLCAIDIVVNQINNEFPVTAFVFACPRVGEENFKKAYGTLKNLQILRISNASDPVPKLPWFGPVDGSATDLRFYQDVGFELSIDTTKSNYLKKSISGHILEVYLHGIAGTHGPGEFKLEINRDIALMNKADDVLMDEYGVPVSWWIEKNKGMVQQDGSWILMDHEDDDTVDNRFKACL